MLVYFERLSVREKILILVMIGLIGVLVLTTLIVRPVLGYRANARDSFKDAAEIHALTARAAAAPSTTFDDNGSSLRAALTNTAAESGIVINRLNSQGAEIDVSIGNTTTVRLYAWLARLANEHQVFVQDGAIQPSADGTTITARLTVKRGR
ncbi:type II secretion system protein GspM [Parvularcula sp. LCG005]|uniref:type II secretion system protein GspM n=1 Tax=Parvularcula sp. LCG005 TaxID=3078805 RepID=UPI002942E2FB|nr:type II secretion system protein GspM [Parvularcula sp. LCG005]WOI54376.1 type II secretion system protein GspM [Parvularcula sp. LCG005]